MVDYGCARSLRSESRLVGVAFMYIRFKPLYAFDGKKFNDFVVNKTIENIVQKNILKSKNIKSIHMNLGIYAGGSRIVKSLDADHSYKISRPYLKYACCSYPYGLRKNFCKHQCAIILQYTNNSESVLLEFCGTYFRRNR